MTHRWNGLMQDGANELCMGPSLIGLKDHSMEHEIWCLYRLSLQVLLTGYALFWGGVVSIPPLVLVPVFLSPTLAVVVSVG